MRDSGPEIPLLLLSLVVQDPSMSVHIRRAAVADEMLLAGLNRFVQQLHLQHRPDHFRNTQAEELAAWYRSLLEQPSTRVWIAERDGFPVGYLLATVHHASENPFVRARRWCEINQVAVDPDCRRTGVASALISHAVSNAKSEGIVVEATSWSFNDGAHELFRRLGFVPKTIRFELTSPA
jgi:GNAT superfamily N-acetyltransferase